MYTFKQVPCAAVKISERNALLQKCLRKDLEPFLSIESEYPTVLNSQSTEHSFGLYDKADRLVSHVNLWVRDVRFHPSFASSLKPKVCFVGNVATSPELQGQGLMTLMFSHAEQWARQHEAFALILWSDLTLFYQKLGFGSLGVEYRYFFQPDLLGPPKRQSKLEPLSAIEFNEEIFELVQKLRPAVPLTVDRDFLTYKTLLSIPHCTLYLDTARRSFFIVGKGHDMRGVIHEWGAASVADLEQSLCSLSMKLKDTKVLCLLTPTSLTNEWTDRLGKISQLMEEHPMSWIKKIEQQCGGGDRSWMDDNRFFIWGMDSI